MYEIYIISLLILLIGSVFYLIYLQTRNKGSNNNVQLDFISNTINNTQTELAIIKEGMGQITEFTNNLGKNPNFKGTVGEQLVYALLKDIPEDYITQQYLSTPKSTYFSTAAG